MSRVFISGSISLNQLPNEVMQSFDNIISQNMEVYVGDAKGVDVATQQYFSSKNYTNVTVCTIYEKPRNIVADFFKIQKIFYDETLKSEREKQTAKDDYMTQHSNYSFVIWDGKSKGSYNNINRAFHYDKKLKVYITNEQRYLLHNELHENSIESIYKANTGYTLTEVVQAIKSLNIFVNISKPSELKKWLIEHKVLEEKNKKIEVNSKYKNYFIIEKYRGTQNIKYKLDILNLIESNSMFGIVK